jgi:hypothetical protein
MHDIVMIGIVMEQHQFLCAALRNYVDGFTPVAVPPAAFTGFVFFGKILRVINEDIAPSARACVRSCRTGISRFVVGGVDENSIFGFKAKAHASLRMVEPRGLQLDAIFQLRCVLRRCRRNRGACISSGRYPQGSRARPSDRPGLASGCVSGWSNGRGSGSPDWRTTGPKERHSLNVIPMEMRNENVGRNGMRSLNSCRSAWPSTRKPVPQSKI